MPIKNPNDYPKNWADLSRAIRARSGGQCECVGYCGLHMGDRCVEQNGTKALFASGKVVLTVAHLDHDPTNNEPDNLRAMCQRCHLRLDREQHIHNAAVTRAQKRAAGTLPLFD